ncbi:unnamed protein product [Calicophoron daubneyi]|uniref:tryptophan--tRNA ligase n=1 Tax=Calicophoron daubneyi TaxID=300641 RepID=A0AAV2T2S8_CALDB
MLTTLCRIFRPVSGQVIRRFISAQSVNQIALTGIQPTGTPHLGNYLGAIKPCVDIQKSGSVSKLLLIIADLHALTSGARIKISENSMELTAILLTCLNGPHKSSACQPIIFLQSAVFGHTELAWILSTCCSLPRLAHLPQWRDKSGSKSLASDLTSTFIQTDKSVSAYQPVDELKAFERASIGLFTYPVLQAADILLYGAHIVPVGVDQTAHIELARDLVRISVARWPSLSSILRIPSSLVLGVPKINSLRNPVKKMSKSDGLEAGIIYVTDDPDTIRQKVKRAQTDSIRSITYDPEERPGVSNLLRILAAVEERDLNEIVQEASAWDKETLKSHVVDALVRELDPIRTGAKELMSTPEGQDKIIACLEQGAVLANSIARNRLEAIYSATGCGLLRSASSKHHTEGFRIKRMKDGSFNS